MRTPAAILLMLLLPLTLPASDEGTRIAVFAFKNITGESRYDWIGEGIAESLTHTLSSISSVRVVERSRLGQILKEQELSLSGAIDEKSALKTGKLMSATRIMTGSFQVRNGAVLVNARIVDTESGALDPRGGISVKGELGQIFKLYETASSLVLEKFGITPAEEEVRIIKAKSKPASTLRAYTSYLEGRSHMRRYTAKGYEQAIISFEDATLEDPSYAFAFCGLAECFARLAYEKSVLAKQVVVQGEDDEAKTARTGLIKETFIKARGYAATALALSPGLPEAHKASALVYYLMDDSTNAAIAARTLLSLSRNEAYGYFIIGSMDDDLDKGLRSINKALEIDPNLGEAYRDVGYYYKKKNDAAASLKAYRRGIQLAPLNADLRIDAAYLLFQTGNYEDSARQFEQALKNREGDAYAKLGYAVVKYKLGKKSHAVALFNDAVRTNFNWYSFPTVLKNVHKWTPSMLRDWSELKQAGETKKY